MAGTPCTLVAKIEIAQGTGEREVTIVRAGTPGRGSLLEDGQGPIDLVLLALLPGLVPFFLRSVTLLVNQQQRRIENAIGERSKRQRGDAFLPRRREQRGRRRLAVEILADHMAIEGGE